jgi:hypothetical protein
VQFSLWFVRREVVVEVPMKILSFRDLRCADWYKGTSGFEVCCRRLQGGPFDYHEDGNSKPLRNASSFVIIYAGSS